jgi:hypothetical protein
MVRFKGFASREEPSSRRSAATIAGPNAVRGRCHAW